ncbi:hypothetical protein ACWD4V_31955 [Streptomyces tsukubensis]|uniref:hypothetical protein n=1 Tax=Streptomyces tsukubensis TaxID=83656 RepID=UPI0036988EB9
MTSVKRAQTAIRHIRRGRAGTAAACLLLLGTPAGPAHAATASPAPDYRICGAVLWSTTAGVTAAHCLNITLPPTP